MAFQKNQPTNSNVQRAGGIYLTLFPLSDHLSLLHPAGCQGQRAEWREDLEKQMEKTLSRGKVMVEEMKREQYETNLIGLCLNKFGDGKRKVKDDIPVSSLSY